MVAEALARWAHDVRWSALPAASRTFVVDTLVDTVGVTLAGARAPELAPLDAAAPGLGWNVPGTAQLWGRTERVPGPVAALRNATAAHVLDFDDIHTVLHGHPSAVLWPTLLALVEEDGLPFTAALDGYVAGLGVMDAVATLLGPRHYSLGWHSTATVGAVGAAVAGAIALGLTVGQVRDAIGAAVSTAGGVRANFGTLLKPMHAGFAARSGVEVARWVAAGVTPAPGALTGPLGALAVFGDGTWATAGLSRDEQVAHLLARADGALRHAGIKAWPACRGAHYAIEAALGVHGELRAHAAGQRIDAARVEVPYGSRTALVHDDPSTGMQARFSLPYAVATTLVRGWPELGHFDDDAVHDPEARRVMDLLEVVEDASAGDLSSTMEGRWARVRARTCGGVEREVWTDDARGSATRPLTPDDVDQKFRGTAGLALEPDRVEELLAAMRGDVESFVPGRLLAGTGPATASRRAS